MATAAQPLMEAAPWRRVRTNDSEHERRVAFRVRARKAFSLTLRLLAGLLLVGLAVALTFSFISHHPADPSLNSATDAAPRNMLGLPGAYASDALLQMGGVSAALPALALLLAGAGVIAGLKVRWIRLILCTLLSMLIAAAAAGISWPAPLGEIGAGSGGVIGLMAATALAGIALPSGLDPALPALIVALLLGVAALLLFLRGVGFGRRNLEWLAGGFLALKARFARNRSENEEWDTEDDGAADLVVEAEAEAEPIRPARLPVASKAVAPEPAEAPAPSRPLRRIFGPQPAPAPAAKQSQKGSDSSDLPSLSLLKPPPRSTATAIDSDALEANARLLESVLEDYGVKGRIVGLAQGPVVTLYELEPAPGIKASRVIGLADDIARSMSAISARVAVIPGRNVIGIELPNQRREMVSLSELVASDSFASAAGTLPIVLGKDIAGGPVVADLAPMPHLLIAGTTGSGKSVGLNAIILSLLYRLRPDQCRMIMIDPKMLELSVYDDIPHLLAPVVTEPQKAIRALKWAVEQMEDRYRRMAHINVRSLSGYNLKVQEALKTGTPFVKRVQTGWDEDGQPEFEELTLPLEPLPLIVVVVDELADLMMTAGKEVEFLIQRLAQKARAAGIHLIMATQRPSVDVITGVIKANLPTRISFQVTSKIDSRTILGEQGAEQLLGKGDMLYMPGGKQVVRVHGPFVSDEEVEAVAEHWKAQGQPDYLPAVTEEPVGGDVSDAPSSGRSGAAGASGEGDLLQQAIQIVATSRKATISYLQRQMRIGYNSAARLIEEMQDMGLISAPDHVGRREVLMDETGNRN